MQNPKPRNRKCSVSAWYIVSILLNGGPNLGKSIEVPPVDTYVWLYELWLDQGGGGEVGVVDRC
jgi:hypothetical protein